MTISLNKTVSQWVKAGAPDNRRECLEEAYAAGGGSAVLRSLVGLYLRCARAWDELVPRTVDDVPGTQAEAEWVTAMQNEASRELEMARAALVAAWEAGRG